jgi:folate-dependent phosphoribosylglycinamide formyltransferase PurN
VKIFLILQDEPFYLFDELKLLIQENEIVGATVLSQWLPADSISKLVRRYIFIFGIIGFLKLCFKTAYLKFFKMRNIETLFQRSGVTVFKTDNINSTDYVDRVLAETPDLIVSIACPQKLKSELLSTSRLGAINLHGGYLPDFPGVFTPFWNLLKGSNEAGCTVHWIDDTIDGGDIIERTKFSINGGMTIMQIYGLISSHGTKLLIDSIRLIEQNAAPRLPNLRAQGSYNSFPNASDSRDFRRKGLKAI